MGIRTFFKLKINIAELDNFFPNSQKCSKIYQTELIIDAKKNNKVRLKVFLMRENILMKK